MNNLKLLFLFLFSTCLVPELAAQPFQILAGGEIYYEIIGAKKYKVTAHVYRMCDMPALAGLKAYVYGGPYKLPMSFTRISISRMDDKCGNSNPCDKQNAVSNPGFEKHTFEDTIDFNTKPYDSFVNNNVCNISFAIRMNGRSWTVSTYDPITAFYLDAATDICLSNITKNTSPKFSMEPKFQAWCNMPFRYSPGPLDTTDNDSFAFSLVDVQEDYQIKITYKSSFNAQSPITPFCTSANCGPSPNASPPKGFYFDKQTCMTVFTPTTCSEVSAIKYRIDEYRFNKQKQKHEWLGFVTREMMIQVQNSTGNNPTAIPTANILNVCKGNKICTTITTTDVKGASQSTADTTTLLWDNGVKDATFSISNPTAREKQGDFCWQTNNKSGRTEASFFTMAAFDKQCNVNLASKTFRVNVNPTHPYKYKNTIGKCGLVKWDLSSFYDSLYPSYKGISKTVVRSFPNNAILYSGYKVVDSFVLSGNGKIVIEHTFDTLCPVTVRDTFTIIGMLALPDVIYPKDSVYCKDKILPFTLKASLISDLKSFKWLLNDSVINQSDTTIYVKMLANSRIKIVLESNQGCFSEKSFNYVLKKLKLNAIISVDDTFCPGTLAVVYADITSLKSPISFFWKINGKDSLFNYSYLIYRMKNDAKVSLTVKDADQCEFSDSVFYKTWPSVKFKLSHDSAVCKDSTTKVKARNIMAVEPYSYRWAIDQNDIVNNDSILQLKPKESMDISLLITDRNGCSLKETVMIQAIKTPMVKLGGDIQSCYNNLVNIKPSITNRPKQVNYQWSNNNGIFSTDSVLNRKFTNSQLVKLRVSNQLNCSTEDDININLYSQSVLSIVSDKNYFPKSTVTLSTTKPFMTYYWFNGRTTAVNVFKASDLGPPGKYKLWCRTTDANNCEYNDTVEVTIDKDTRVGSRGMHELKIYPNPVSGILMIEALEKSGMDLFSMDGRLLVSHTLEAGSNQIDMSVYGSGIYFIRLSVDGESYIYKIIKE